MNIRPHRLDRLADPMLLENKISIGAIGSAVGHADAYASEGAGVYLTGRTLDTLDRVAEEIRSAGMCAPFCDRVQRRGPALSATSAIIAIGRDARTGCDGSFDNLARVLSR